MKILPVKHNSHLASVYQQILSASHNHSSDIHPLIQSPNPKEQPAIKHNYKLVISNTKL